LSTLLYRLVHRKPKPIFTWRKIDTNGEWMSFTT